MVGEINKYYVLFKDDITNSIAWMKAQGLDKVSVYDVAMFYIGSGDAPLKDRKAIDADYKLSVTEKDYKVDFAKITKRVNQGMMVYGYKSELHTRPKLIGSEILLNQDGKCRYMPVSAVISAEDPGNFTHEELIVGRETSGKHVCDNIDATDITTIRSLIWMPSVMYEDGKTELPIAHNSLEIPQYMINSISLLGKLSGNVYRTTQDSTVKDTNGIIVIPVLMLLRQLMDASITAGDY